jgi:protein ImuA
MIRSLRLDQLRALSAPTTRQSSGVETAVAFGVDSIDRRIAGGLTRRALHEVFAASPEDASAATGFALMMAMRASPAGRSLIWVREGQCGRMNGHLYATGLADLGFNPDDLVLVDAPDTLAALRAGADIVKCGQVGAVVIEPWGKALAFDLTASRRLSMAAAVSGVFTLVVRNGAAPMPSAAHSRWQVAGAPSTALAANAPGYPAFDISLLRHRGGVAGLEARVEWNRDTRSFAPLSGGVSATAALATDPADQRQAA